MSVRLKVTSTTLIDWYDGIVSGVVRADGLDFLCVLLAFDADRKLRRYALVPIPGVQLPTRFVGPTLDLDESSQSALMHAKATAAVIYLTRDEPDAGVELELESCSELQAAQIRALAFPSIEDAVEDSAGERWL